MELKNEMNFVEYKRRNCNRTVENVCLNLKQVRAPQQLRYFQWSLFQIK